MRKRIKTEKELKTDYESVKEIKVVYSDIEANELLNQGWKLINSGVAHVDNGGYNAKPCFTFFKD